VHPVEGPNRKRSTPSASNLLHCSAASHEWRLFKSPPSAPGNPFLQNFLGSRAPPRSHPRLAAAPPPPAPGGSPGASSLAGRRRSREVTGNCSGGGAFPAQRSELPNPSSPRLAPLTRPLGLLAALLFFVRGWFRFCMCVRSGGDFASCVTLCSSSQFVFVHTSFSFISSETLI
jgi:hypothetical protein